MGGAGTSDNGDMEGPGCAGCRERDALIAELLARMAVLEQRLAEQARRLAEQDQRLAELEARLKTNSTNSSLPPSANPPAAPKPPAKPPTGRKPGGQPGHPGHGRPRLPADELVQHVPAQCERCHAPLSAEAGPTDPPPTCHQVVEVPPVLATVTEHQAHGRTCAACGQVTWGRIPAAVLAHGSGPNLTALSAFFSGRCHPSKRTTEEILATVFGVPISLRSVAKT